MQNQEMEMSGPNEIVEIRALIDTFISERLQAKLDKLDKGEDDKRQRLHEEHKHETWIADAARRVGQIQLASHTLKPIHPDARGTNIYLRENQCAENALVGTHILTHGRADDVVGNAAALDVFKFLKLPHGGKTLLDRAVARDVALLAAFSDDAGQAQMWADAFAGIIESKMAIASHTLAKQLYFPLQEGGYHLLAPLFPTALAHRLHKTLEADRFSDAAKEARAARKEKRPSPHGYREYPNLAVQNFGGSKPQNISQLNSERRGINHLLPSLPPIWQSASARPPLRRRSVFGKYGAFGGRRDVREITQTLSKFLLRVGEYNNIHIRSKRAELVNEIIDALFSFAKQIQSLPSGWSAQADCQLDIEEKRWLDPGAREASEEGPRTEEGSSGAANVTIQTDWRNEIANRFANWLNAAIRTDDTPMSDEEHLAWKTLLSDALNEVRKEMSDES
jgi:CRISPR-associated protein Csy1